MYLKEYKFIGLFYSLYCIVFKLQFLCKNLTQIALLYKDCCNAFLGFPLPPPFSPYLPAHPSSDSIVPSKFLFQIVNWEVGYVPSDFQPELSSWHHQSEEKRHLQRTVRTETLTFSCDFNNDQYLYYQSQGLHVQAAPFRCNTGRTRWLAHKLPLLRSVGFRTPVAKQPFPYSWANGLLGSSFEVGMKPGAWREQALGRDYI